MRSPVKQKVASAATFASAATRVLPLRGLALQGRFGADKGTSGVTLRILHPLTLVMVISRKGKSKAVREALSGLKGVLVMDAGPDQYYVQAEGIAGSGLAARLTAALKGSASVIDQSHGRVVISVAGPEVRRVLAKGTPVDVHPEEFPVGQSALTQMAHVGIHMTRVGENEFLLSVFRGFSESFWEWLTASAAEFGYQVI